MLFLRRTNGLLCPSHGDEAQFRDLAFASRTSQACTTRHTRFRPRIYLKYNKAPQLTVT